MAVSLRETCLEYFHRRLREGWKCISLVGYKAVLQSPEGILRPIDLRNDVETLRPDSAGAEENLNYGTSGSGNHWQDVDEAIHDEYSSLVSCTAVIQTYERDLYNIANSVSSGTINNIKVYAVFLARNAVTQPSAKIAIKSGTTVDESSEITVIQDSWTSYSNEWSTNPDTSNPFTFSEIDSLQIGIALRAEAGTASANTKCTQVYVEIDYTVVEPAAVDVGIAVTAARSLKSAREASVDVGVVSTADRQCVYHRYGWRP